MPPKFKGKLIPSDNSEKARLFESPTGERMWLAKSITPYFHNDGQNNVTFSVEHWKVKDVRAKGFDEE